MRMRCVDDGERCDCLGQRGAGACLRTGRRYPLPDLLLLDLKMPKKSGFDVLRMVEENPEGFTHLPVIILSSSDDPRDVRRANDLGATKYF